MLRVRIEFCGEFSLPGKISTEVTGDDDVGRVVVADAIVENFDLIVGIDDDSRARRNARYGSTRNCKVRGVVAVNVVVENAGGVAALGNAWHVEHQDAASVVIGDVVIYIGANGVLNFYACDVIFGPIIAHDHLAGLSDVNACVRCADSHVTFQQYICGLHRINSIGAILRIGTVGPFCAYAANSDVVAFINF